MLLALAIVVIGFKTWRVAFVFNLPINHALETTSVIQKSYLLAKYTFCQQLDLPTTTVANRSKSVISMWSVDSWAAKTGLVWQGLLLTSLIYVCKTSHFSIDTYTLQPYKDFLIAIGTTVFISWKSKQWQIGCLLLGCYRSRFNENIFCNHVFCYVQHFCSLIDKSYT